MLQKARKGAKKEGKSAHFPSEADIRPHDNCIIPISALAKFQNNDMIHTIFLFWICDAYG